MTRFDAPPGGLFGRAPDARAQSLRPDDPAVVDEEVDPGSAPLHVPGEDDGIGTSNTSRPSSAR